MPALPLFARNRTALAAAFARWGLVLFFAWLVGRFWHPYYGFTSFIQLDASDSATLVPELRDSPIYIYPHTGGYDGATYAQLATRPAATDPVLATAIDNLPYRSRRIFLSWVAYVFAGGDAIRAVQIYATLNLVVWLGLAWVLTKLFPARDWRSLLACAGILFSAGALHSVRLALTDLAALTLLAAAMWSAENNRANRATILLGVAGLVRETSLLASLALWPGFAHRTRWREWLRIALTVAPLLAWLIYLRINIGTTTEGSANFTWPGAGLVEKIFTAVRDLSAEPNTWLAITTLLALIGMLTQIAYLARHRDWRNAWWRLGALQGLLMLTLGHLVWEGHPGAATRVLLPLTLAFNVLAFRQRASVRWLILGNLGILSGVLALWHVPHDRQELAAGRITPAAYIVQTDESWYPIETRGSKRWAWCAQEGQLQLTCWPRTETHAETIVTVRAISPRQLVIKQGNTILWRGEISLRPEPIVLTAEFSHGRATLHFASPAAPVIESTAPGARALGFAVSGVEVK